MFGSQARRRSIGLPSNQTQQDPFADKHSGGRFSNGGSGGTFGRAGAVQQFQDVWMASSSRSRVLKTGGVIAFVVFLFFLFSGRGGEQLSNLTTGHGVVSNTGTGTNGATKCSKPYDSKKPLIQYALMVDAGSSGSRIHVYKFNNCGPNPELEHEEFKMTPSKDGGLSSFDSDAEGAAKSLDMLMDVAVNYVPKEYQSCSPVAVKATAGLRMLGSEKSERILEAVRTRLETVYPFPVVSREKDGVVIMDGKDEGVYAWITVNYLLGKIGGPDKTPTAATFDLGGGSTQIVFQPTFKAPNGGMPETLAAGDHKYALDFGGRKFELYQHSHLGYGLNAAKKTIYKNVIQAYLAEHASTDPDTLLSKPIENPCFPPNVTFETNLKLDDKDEKSKVTVTMTGPAVGHPAQCRALAEKMLNKETQCALAPCSFNGIHQPSFDKTFSKEEVIIMSFFYDRTHPLGMPESFTLRELRDLTAQVCEGKESWGSFESVKGAIKELGKYPEYCMDLSFMMALLHTGYEMPMDREVKIAKKIKGNEVGWCLGASLPLLSQTSGWTCRVKEI